MNTIQLLHDATFYAMYIAAGFALFVIVERQIFYLACSRDARKLLRCIDDQTVFPADLMERPSVPARVVRELLQSQRESMVAGKQEDRMEAIYIGNKVKIIARLWILDTVVTAAPLLGLVGTILGIIDTFAVLASSGISDPSGVSKGIGTALYATALGISIALLGLLCYNYLRECADRLNDSIKILLLRANCAAPEVRASAFVQKNRAVSVI